MGERIRVLRVMIGIEETEVQAFLPLGQAQGVIHHLVEYPLPTLRGTVDTAQEGVVRILPHPVDNLHALIVEAHAPMALEVVCRAAREATLLVRWEVDQPAHVGDVKIGMKCNQYKRRKR